METGQSEAKRTRLSSPGPSSPWHSHQGPILPPPQQLLPTHTHPQHHPGHHSSLSPYSSHGPYSRGPDPHPVQHHLDDRRHHDQEPYPPPPPLMQDHHRQPPSPVHAPPFPPYRRDSIVKREAADDTLAQMRRPNSTGNAPDGLPPPPPHGPPPYPSQHPEDHRRPPSFDSGPSMPHSPQVYRPPPQQPSFHPPPTPVAQHGQYEAPSHAFGPGQSVQDMYSSIPIPSAKRKAQRASQACDSCRQLKAKCDEQRPCNNCVLKNIGHKCNYRDLPAKHSLRSQITSEFGKMDQRMTNLEQAIKVPRRSSDLKVESIEGEGDRHESELSAHDEHRSSPQEPSDPEVENAHNVLLEMDEAEIENQPGPPVIPGQPTMPADHTTLAALLLKWPSIGGMVGDLIQEKIHYIDEFPIRQEQQRGLLRVFGRGEGFDQEIRPASSRLEHEPQDQIMTEVTDDFSEGVASPMPSGDVWGQVGGLTPYNVDYKGGVLNMDGNPDFDREKVTMYVKSFKDNILNMHPILVPKQLDAMVTMFLKTLPPPPQPAKPMGQSSGAKFVNENSRSNIAPSVPETGTKRKRSPAAEEQNPSIAFQKPGLPYRSIHSALVLAVLALGKICLHKGAMPDVVHEQDQQMYGSPSVRNGILASPSQGSPPGHIPQSQSSGLPSPKEYDRSMSSRRPSLQGAATTVKGAHTMKRNVDVIPGLEYYALAADIFGSHIGGNSLKHVYTALFLGLYHGQLGRVGESWSYTALGCRTLQVILRPSLSRLQKLKEDGQLPDTLRDNLLAFSFWTCLQLESDILAELQMPQSGILNYESTMPYPNLSSHSNEGYSELVTSSYQAQLYLRKQLNNIHNSLYSRRSPHTDKTMEEELFEIQDGLKNAKSSWVPEKFEFWDNTPPAPDILAARLRAKYWGSQVILYRPYIDVILRNERLPDRMFRHGPPPPEQWSKQGIDVGGVCLPRNIDPRAVSYARLGIFALVESTRAFHGLDRRQRILVTNVFTTAHAQWGNLLVLAACHTHPILQHFIQRDLLQDLFIRTIEFFRLIAHRTSPLLVDMNILIGLARKLNFYLDDFDPRASSSFSSVTSAGPSLPTQNPAENYNPGTPVMPPPFHGIP
ncbi:hypothetical protein BJ170DRAFT_716509 [Xylariales sp. AK1849]|nr:hypothetical protein BJ170DRAFT_716509 [Xylariales sp. AK1849]